MHGTLLLLLTLAGVPEVAAGPDLALTATETAAPVVSVTVFSDRARVTRRGTARLGAGITTLRFPDLPGATLLPTLRLGCREAKVLRVEATPVEQERSSIDQVEELLVRLEELTDRIRLLDGERQVRTFELGLLARLQPKAPVDEAERVGKPAPPLAPAAWRVVLEFLQARADGLRSQVRQLGVQRRTLLEELEGVRREVRAMDLGAFAVRRIQVVAILQSPAPTVANLELQYQIPGASWKPRYDLTYLPDRGQVRLAIAGTVKQATGEEWPEVALELSTAIPGQSIELPELLTWALGEKKEFVPVVRAARQPPEPKLNPPPSPRGSHAEQERQGRRELLQERLAELDELLELDLRQPEQTPGGSSHAVQLAAVGSSSSYSRSKEARKSMAPPPPPSAPPPRPMMAMAPEPAPAFAGRGMADSLDGEVELEEMDARVQSRSGGEGFASRNISGLLSLSGKAAPSTTSLQLFEAEPTDPARALAADSPALLAGGLDYVWSCPTRVTVPSKGEGQSVPLAVLDLPVEVLYEATPALKKTAYLAARVTHQGDRPILRGQANIFMGTDFVGQGELQTTGPGGLLELPLGADEDIRLERTVVPASQTKGLFGKEEVTTYTTTIEVGNYKQRPVRIAIHDVLPKSGREEIKIDRGKLQPAPVKGPDEDGVIRWELDLPPGQTQTITFTYTIRRPEHWLLQQ